MDPNRFTEKTQQAIMKAQQMASERGNPEIDPEHMLLALLKQPEGVVPRIVLQLGSDPQQIGRAHV